MKKTALLAIAMTTALSTVNPAFSSDDKVVAVVNGQEITDQTLNMYASSRQAGSGQQIPNEMLVQELINRELIAQDALKQGLDKNPEYMATLKDQVKSLLAAFAIKQQVNDANKITDEEIKKEYDAYVSTLTDNEYQASHILLETEEDANEVIKALDSGENFAKLAMEKSTGPSGPEGGKLGWFRSEQMVKEFSDAVKGMEKGSYSKKPVNTQFGWHVILLEDTREITPPTFDSLKDQIARTLANKRVQAYIEGLRASSDIEIKQ